MVCAIITENLCSVSVVVWKGMSFLTSPIVVVITE